jgi:hypothetical protein
MRTEFFWVVMQRVVVIPYRRFGTTYRPHLEASGIKRFFTIEDGTDWLCETSVNNYHYSLRNNPSERISEMSFLKIQWLVQRMVLL